MTKPEKRQDSVEAKITTKATVKPAANVTTKQAVKATVKPAVRVTTKPTATKPAETKLQATSAAITTAKPKISKNVVHKMFDKLAATLKPIFKIIKYFRKG